MSEMTPLKQVYNQIQAWAVREREWDKAFRKSGSPLEANAYLERAKNLEAMLPAIEAAIAKEEAR